MDISHLAALQLEDYDRRQPGLRFGRYASSLSFDEAYQVQFQVAEAREARGERVAGFKVGCVSGTMQQQLGLDRPVFGHVWESEIHPSDVVLNAANFDGLAIEGELAVRLAVDVPDVDWLKEHLHEAALSAFVVIELHNYVFRNAPHTAAELIGNNALHAGVVLPVAEPPLTNASSLMTETVSVYRNGAMLGSATAAALEGGPLGSVVRVAEHLALHGRLLRRGQLILTGSTMPLWRVETGDRIEVNNRALGDAARASVGAGRE